MVLERSLDLPEDVAERARIELREEETCKEQAVQQFKEWVVKNHDLQNVSTDPDFLLRFLRVKKFSVPMAEIMLLKYLNLRQTFQHFFYNLDYLEPSVLELIDNGYLFPSPVRDKNGRKVIIGIAANFDPHKYTNIDMAKVHSITYETLMDDPVNHVVGYTHFGDFKSVSTAHVTLWSPTEFATIFKWGEQSVPMRHKEVHCLNVPSALKYVYDFTRSRLSQKIKDRFIVHNTLEEVHSKLDPKVLPKEYGGEIPMAEMIDIWKKDLAAKRDKLLSLDKMKLLDNTSILKNRSNARKGFDEINLVGSFRKLEVD